MAAARTPVRGRSRTEVQPADEHVEVLDGTSVLEMLRNQPEKGPTDAVAKVQASKHFDGVVTRNAVAGQEEEETKVPTKQHFVVLADRHVQGAAGQRTLMRAGKVLDTQQYDIIKLKQQGLQLRPYDPETDGLTI